MKTRPVKYLYCLISRLNDTYYEQAYISITSLRMHTPNAFVSIFTDKETIESIHDRKIDITKIVDEIVLKDFENNIKNKIRSRILKTTIRNKIDGDFLFIDCDTIICNDLSEITNYEFDFGAVLSRHALLHTNFYMSNIIKKRKALYNNPDYYNHPYYFNSGVLFVKDTNLNRDFFNKYYENYILTNKNNIDMDQPALSLTNYQLNFPIKELDGSWNVQTWYGANYFHKAKIFHYFSTVNNKKKYEPFFSILPLRVKENGYLSEEDLNLIAMPLRYFGNVTNIISDENYDFYHSNVSAFYRKLYKYKFLFKIIDYLFYLPRLIKYKFLK